MTYYFRMIDGIDRELLRLLQHNARLSNAELAKSVGLTVSSVHERVKKLEQKGIIRGYVALVDPEKLGKPLLAFVRLTLMEDPKNGISGTLDAAGRLCAAEPDILECHDVAGEDCLVVKLRAGDTRSLQKLIAKIRNNLHVIKSVTSIVLLTMKEETAVKPFDGDEGKSRSDRERS